jgi:hypothetical protein
LLEALLGTSQEGAIEMFFLSGMVQGKEVWIFEGWFLKHGRNVNL